MSRLDRTNAPHHVYRCYEASGRLVYVGSSADLFGPLEQHRNTSWWAPTVVRVTAQYFPNGVAAREVERRAIREEVPRWNKAGKWAGRNLWTREDWHDWIVTLLRDTDRMTPQLAGTLKDYQSLFRESIPEDLAARVAEASAASARIESNRQAMEAQRAKEHAAREAAELRELNAELRQNLERQAALARALGIDWHDPDLLDAESAIDEVLARLAAEKGAQS